MNDLDKVISIDGLLNMLAKYNHKELHLHHTWRPDHETYFKKPDPLYWQAAMRRYHKENNGWNDIGQHVTLLPDGRFVTGRDFGRDPASIKGYNTKAFAVEMLGDFDIGRDPFDGPQKRSAILLARWFDKRGRYIRFHRESAAKTCPGSSINKYDFMKEVRDGDDKYAQPTLRRGSRGETVKALQDALNKLGYKAGEVDGIFGPKTESAVKAFQKANKLVQDGIVGPLTWAALDKALKALKPDTGSVISRLTELEKKTKQILSEIQNIKKSLSK